MLVPRFVEIDGHRYLWRDLVALRCAARKPLPAPRNPPFSNCARTAAPAGERNVAERYQAPSLFIRLERSG